MGDVSMLMSKKDDCIDLPPGFRFHPSDEEIVTHYLYERVKDATFSAIAIGEADLNKCEPWDLPKLATMGEKEYYFFCERDKKYPTGMRTNRATISGYWKATGKDKEIYKGKGCLVGMKKTLVFYLGRAPKGEKTNWVMHEYRLEGKTSYWKLPKNAKDEWVVCRVFHKNTGLKKNPDTEMWSMNPSAYGDNLSENSTLPPLAESPYLMSNNYNPSSSFISNNEGGDHFRGIHTGAIKSTSSYMMMDRYQIENLQKGFAPNCYSTMASNSSLYQHIPTPNMPFPNMGYSHHGDFRGFGATQYDTASPLRRHCKVEQFSNQSGISASPETSGVSRQEMETVHGNDQTYNVMVDGQISSRTTLVELDSLLNKYS